MGDAGSMPTTSHRSPEARRCRAITRRLSDQRHIKHRKNERGFWPIREITTRIKNVDVFMLNVIAVNPQQTRFIPNDVLESGDTFFTFSYGGVKAMRVWGPMGFFGDFRGRTLPNFFGSATTRPELSAGLTFSWGER